MTSVLTKQQKRTSSAKRGHGPCRTSLISPVRSRVPKSVSRTEPYAPGGAGRGQSGLTYAALMSIAECGSMRSGDQADPLPYRRFEGLASNLARRRTLHCHCHGLGGRWVIEWVPREAEEGHASVDDRCHARSDGRRRWIERIYRIQGIPNDGWEARSYKEQAVMRWLQQGSSRCAGCGNGRKAVRVSRGAIVREYQLHWSRWRH